MFIKLKPWKCKRLNYIIIIILLLLLFEAVEMSRYATKYFGGIAAQRIFAV
jgi:hypothetical protein